MSRISGTNVVWSYLAKSRLEKSGIYKIHPLYCSQCLNMNFQGYCYEGSFVDNQISGNGKLKMPDGSVYEGLLFFDKPGRITAARDINVINVTFYLFKHNKIRFQLKFLWIHFILLIENLFVFLCFLFFFVNKCKCIIFYVYKLL